MTVTLTTAAKTTVRTYELFDLAFADGTRVTGFNTADEADSYLRKGSRPGKVERRTFQVQIPKGHEHLYAPGIDGEVPAPETAGTDRKGADRNS